MAKPKTKVTPKGKKPAPKVKQKVTNMPKKRPAVKRGPVMPPMPTMGSNTPPMGGGQGGPMGGGAGSF